MNTSLAAQTIDQPKPEIVSAPMTTKDKLIILVIFLVIVGFVCLIILPIYLVPDYTTIVIVGTNDLHGKVYPTTLFRADNQQEYKYGGLTYMSTLMGIVNN